MRLRLNTQFLNTMKKLEDCKWEQAWIDQYKSLLKRHNDAPQEKN